MSDASLECPRLRPIEGHPIDNNGQEMILLHDPTGLAESSIALSPPAFLIATLLDGTREPHEVLAEFFKQTGHAVSPEQLASLLEALRSARLLEGPEFERHYERVVSEYRNGTHRKSNDLAGAGLEPHETLRELFERMFPGEVEPDASAPSVMGLIAPHLDYKRGWECYARVYSAIRGLSDVRRFVILGTNHFGRSSAVVATDKHFVTPLGTTCVDRAFLSELGRQCGTDLCAYEYDHAREHSVELQLFALQALFGAENFSIVPVLCPDPCGPTGTRPITGEGADLQVFAEHLRELLAEDPVRTIVIAGADLSHVGRRFGDDKDLDPMFLHEVSERDQRAMIAIRENDPEKLRIVVATDDNPTRICSAGCIYALLSALPNAEPKLLRYDQTQLEGQDTCVTCSAFVLTGAS